MGMNMQYRAYVLDEHNKRIKDTGFCQSKSLTLQFMQILWAQMAATSNNVIRITGQSQAVNANASNLGMFYTTIGPSDNYGIRVGNSNTPYAYDQYRLQEEIVHGSDNGQLIFGSAQWPTHPQKEGSNVEMFLTRSFSNKSGGTVTIREIGLYGNGWSASYFYMLARDVLASELAVANNQIVHIQYRFYTTV